jgi:hypothetical protein
VVYPQSGPCGARWIGRCGARWIARWSECRQQPSRHIQCTLSFQEYPGAARAVLRPNEQVSFANRPEFGRLLIPESGS